MDALSEPAWGSIDRAAAKWDVSSDTVRRMIARGDVEAVRLGPRLIRVNLNSIARAARPITVAGAA